jgi:malonyl-CoA O-methyltransferase
VRQLFSRPERVATADFLRREVSSRMFDRLELIK